MQLKFENDKVVDAKFKTFGCGSAIASRFNLCMSSYRLDLCLRTSTLRSLCTAIRMLHSSVATEWVKGKSTEECLELTNADIANELNLPPVKLHCRLLNIFCHFD